MAKKTITLLMILFAGVIACNKDMAGTGFTGFSSPEYFPAPAYHFATNPVTRAGFVLGRKLFNDPLLSANNTISCASCHIQTAAFSHRDHPVSHGIFDRLGTRNAPAIMNLAWSTGFMWDGGVSDLDLQPVVPITSHVEMNDTLERVLERLRMDNRYPAMFRDAYGTPEVTTARFLKALSQFMLLCVSDQSKYDSVRRQQAQFTVVEQRGYALFQQKCNSCHREPLFTDHSFRNNGIPPSLRNDSGRMMITLADTDRYKFKVPTLRNLEFTGPYMHDGRFLTLDAVLEHYNTGVAETGTLDPLLKREGGIAISAEEKIQLLAFLKTLGDKTFLENKQLAEE